MKALNSEKLLVDFYDMYNSGAYKMAIPLIETLLESDKKRSFWYYSRLSSCYYELQDYQKALEYAGIAYKKQAKSPIVLWDYANVLIVTKKERKAIRLLLKLQQLPDDFTVFKFETPQIKWMQSLKNDANFLLGRAFFIVRDDHLAKEYFTKYLLARKRGLKTIYTKKQVLVYLQKIESGL